MTISPLKAVQSLPQALLAMIVKTTGIIKQWPVLLLRLPPPPPLPLPPLLPLPLPLPPLLPLLPPPPLLLLTDLDLASAASVLSLSLNSSGRKRSCTRSPLRVDLLA
jgi:hypothetical protein